MKVKFIIGILISSALTTTLFAEEKTNQSTSREETRTYVAPSGATVSVPGRDQGGTDLRKSQKFEMPEKTDRSNRTTVYTGKE